MIQWANLNKGVCINECNEPLESRGRMVYCKYCDFKMRLTKYNDLLLGKKSKSYQSVVKKFEKIKKYKEKLKQSFETQNQERLFNLKRMLAKGVITQEEYNSKTVDISLCKK